LLHQVTLATETEKEVTPMLSLRRAWPVGAIMAIALLAASCGNQTAETTTTKTNPDTTVPQTTKPTSTTTVSSEKPQYGGTVSILYTGSDILGFDEAYNAPWYPITCHLTEDEMLNGDWTQGSAGGYGTNKWTWTLEGVYNWSSKTGSLCDTWQAIAPNHYTFHVRQGVHFSVDPNNEASKLINGRLMTAEDIVYSYLRLCTTNGSYVRQGHPYFVENLKMTVVDKETIDLVVPNDVDSIYQIAQTLVDWNGTIAKEVIEKWGDMKDWKHAHGTGPYILTDFVSGSSATLEKNTNYWDTNPIGPGKGDQLPYADGVKIFIISDLSTQLSALRTGKIDMMTGVGIDDAKSIKKTNPDLEYFITTASVMNNHMYMRTDRLDLPYHIKEVRQALTKATDFKTLVNSLYDGQASYPSFPIKPLIDLKENYLSLEEASAEVQDLYTYDPTKAKEMLKEAGYPDGFTANVLVQNNETYVDYLSVLKEMWAKVGVTLNIKPLEFAVYNNRYIARDYDELFFTTGSSSGTFRTMISVAGSGGGYNLSYVNDDRMVNGITDMLTAFNSGNDAECAKIHKQLTEIIYEECWVICSPAQNGTTFWWPWLQNYTGETSLGILNTNIWTKYVWIDQNLKKSIEP
jgi:peptide/nickel transport system substrate-binding protein